MRKGQMTKENIIKESAVLFNTKGYSGTSLSEIIDRCGIQKGGIYNHFENKDQIAFAAFEYSVSQILNLLSNALENAVHSKEKLLSICMVYIDIIENNRIEGGCPILNTAIESDDGHPLLKERAQVAMNFFIKKLSMIILQGIDNGEFRKDVNSEEVSSYIIAVVEGGLMLSKLFDDSKYIRQCTNNVIHYIDDRLLNK
ncbi:MULTISPECIES: TetR/AcrR family transcriptional regulator [unclassified Bacillus (in: firmicutes)]|uniref:TetR/AcrR family transcriptional regulator n=1 Tax=unclassified Bacillus (in: firmicutes) TaxID=185979 RepID=UPI0008E1CC6D|nr:MULTISPECIES: TetR/AcrR family transcriptional regulator [unclassified Bacillus (in: firmicutes)]SFA90665.1 DNA-binding transcriptional regulator, AcrR family [Bacillus sp. UNCCL13]SFQ85334.1 DNA-binding transcriptional regulator, AcrR family [Bacillus sp. cl95]